MAEGEEVFNSCGSVTEDRAAADELPDIIPVNGYGEAEGDPNELPKTVIDYYISIEQVLEKEEFENAEERVLLEEKLLKQVTEDGMMKIASHWDGSRVLERLIVNCSSGSLSKVGVLLVPHTIDIACHTFASHVLELFLMRTVTLVYKEGGSETIALAEEVFRKLCLELEKLMDSVYGSYCLRTALQVLIGVRVEEKAPKKGKKRWNIGEETFMDLTKSGLSLHPALRKVLHKFTKRLLKLDFTKMITNEQGGPLLQVLLQLLKHTDNKSLNQLQSSIIGMLDAKEESYKGFETFGALPAMLLHPVASYVIQRLIKVLSSDELHHLYLTYFKSKVVPLSLHHIANYTIQTLLEQCPTEAIAVEMCGELVPVFEDLLAEGHTGVVINVIKCCRHYSLTSLKVLAALQAAFHVPDDNLNAMFRCVMSLTTHDVLLERIAESKKPTQSGKPRRDRFEATLPGSLLLQGLFSMGEVDLLEGGLCSLSQDHILYLSTKTESSHAMEAFLSSVTISSTLKHKFMKTTSDQIEKMALNPAGSRVVEAMWACADSEMRKTIAGILINNEHVVKENTYGRMIWKNCNLTSFKLGTKVWEVEEKKKRKIVEILSEKKEEISPKVLSSVENGVTNIENGIAKVKKKKKRKVAED